MYLKYNLPLLSSLIVLSGALSASASVLDRRDCLAFWLAEEGDTCELAASSWVLTEAEFVQINPGVSCPLLVPGKEYCVEWSGPIISSTTSKPPASTTVPGK
jgi:hypothetical protein